MDLSPIARLHPPEWTYTSWHRRVHWPLLITAAVLTHITITVVAVGYATRLLPVPVAGVALGALAAIWHWYLALPISGVDAHRTIHKREVEEINR